MISFSFLKISKNVTSRHSRLNLVVLKDLIMALHKNGRVGTLKTLNHADVFPTLRAQKNTKNNLYYVLDGFIMVS